MKVATFESCWACQHVAACLKIECPTCALIAEEHPLCPMNVGVVCDNCRTVVGQGLSHYVVANGACEIGPPTAPKVGHFGSSLAYGEEPCNVLGPCVICEGAHQAPCALPKNDHGREHCHV